MSLERRTSGLLAVTAAALALAASGCGAPAAGPDAPSVLAESWYNTDLPETFRPVDARVYRFHEMAKEGLVGAGRIEGDDLVLDVSAPHRSWNGSYWPLAHGGVARRWRGDGNVASDVKPFDPAATPALDLDKLSPLEKYDLVAGNFDFTATRREIERVKSKTWAEWEGYCHGWSVASMLEKAPEASVTMPVKGRDDLKVTFHPEDIKALESKFYGDFVALTRNGTGKRSIEIGVQCLLSASDLAGDKDPDTGEPLRDAKTRRLNDLHCRDVNPGTLHVVLDQFMGSLIDLSGRRSFVIDASADAQVWNYPVVGYRARQTLPEGLSDAEKKALTDDLPRGKLRGNAGCKKRLALDEAAGMARFRGRGADAPACIVDLETDVWYVSLTEATETVGKPVATQRMRLYYSLELDDDGYVTGGEWDFTKVGNHRPDVLWMPKIDFRTIGVESQGGTIDWFVLQRILGGA